MALPRARPGSHFACTKRTPRLDGRIGFDLIRRHWMQAFHDPLPHPRPLAAVGERPACTRESVAPARPKLEEITAAEVFETLTRQHEEELGMGGVGMGPTSSLRGSPGHSPSIGGGQPAARSRGTPFLSCCRTEPDPTTRETSVPSALS